LSTRGDKHCKRQSRRTVGELSHEEIQIFARE
jgi:hypothetical protein